MSFGGAFDQLKGLTMKRKGNGEPMTYRDAKSHFEWQYLTQLLQWARGNVKRAAERADRDRKGLYILMSKYDLDPADFRPKKTDCRE